MTAEKCLVCEKPSVMLPPGHTLGCCSVECAAIAGREFAMTTGRTSSRAVLVLGSTFHAVTELLLNRERGDTGLVMVARDEPREGPFDNELLRDCQKEALKEITGSADFTQAELRVFCQQLVDSAPTGLSIETLVKYAGITVEQARGYRDRLLAQWPKMKAYMDAQAKHENRQRAKSFDFSRDEISNLGGLPPYSVELSSFRTYGLGEPKLEPPPDPPRAFKRGTFFPPQTIAPSKRGNAHTQRNQTRSKKGRPK